MIPQATSDRKLQILIVGIALLLTLAGQFAFYLSPETRPWAFGLSLLGVVLFLLTTTVEAWLQRLLGPAIQNWSTQGILIFFAICLSILATLLAQEFEQAERRNYWPVIALVLLAGLTYIWAFAYNRVWQWPQVGLWLRANRVELSLLAGIVLIGLSLRFYALGQLPRVIDGDEGLIGDLALATKLPPYATPYAWPAEVGGFYMQAIRIVLEMLGPTPFALRFLPALGGSLALVTLYLLGRHLFGVRVALSGAVLLALSHSHIHFSRIASVSYIQGTWVTPLVLYLFFSGLKHAKQTRLALGGVILALHMGVYFDAFITFGITVLYGVASLILYRKQFPQLLTNLATFGLGAFIVVLPQITHFALRPVDFFSRLNKDGMFQSSWLTTEMATTGKSFLQLMLERLIHALSTLNTTPATDFYGARIPLLSVFTATFFVLGAVYTFSRFRDERFGLLTVWFWGATGAVAFFSVPPSADTYRMLIALPAALLIAAVGFDQILQRFLGNEPTLSRAWVLSSTVMALIIGAFNVRVYFFDFVGQCQFGGDDRTRFASYLGNYLREIPKDTPTYLLSTEFLRYGTHISVDFLSQKKTIQNWDNPVETLTSPSGALIIAPALRLEELRSWTATRPGGTWQSEYDCGTPMLFAYRVP